VAYSGEERALRFGRMVYVAIAASQVCLALLAGGCGGASDKASSPTPERQPVAVTGLAGNIGENEAELTARINPNNQPSTTYYFEYGTTTKYGSKTPSKPLSGNTQQTVTADLSDLDPETTYHYRVVAKADTGTLVTGGDQTFTTPPAEGGSGGGSAGDNGTGGGATTGAGTTGNTTRGYTTTPPPSTGGYTTTPPPSTGGYTTTPPPSTGGYTTTPPSSTGGSTTSPPDK
jgi:hypothetical protein